MAFFETDGPTIPGAVGNNKPAKGRIFIDGSATQLEESPPARNTYGTITALAAGATATVVSFVADSAFRFRGFRGTGEADGWWRVKYNGVAVYSDRTNLTKPDAGLILPDPDSTAASVTVTVEVTNYGTGPSNYEATILGD